MEIHRPKPAHTLLEFASEVAVVILGISIALAAEQAVQGLEWRHKMKLADEQIRQEIANDDGPQILERIALSSCVNASLDRINKAIELGGTRSTVADLIKHNWTPRHTWDNTVFQSAEAAGVLARMSVERIDAISRFYSTMPVLESADEREFRDGGMLFISGTDGPFSELERERLLGAIEALRRDNAEIVRLATLGREAMRLLEIRIGHDQAASARSAPLSDPGRVIIEMELQPMAQNCVAELKVAMQAQ